MKIHMTFVAAFAAVSLLAAAPASAQNQQQQQQQQQKKPPPKQQQQQHRVQQQQQQQQHRVQQQQQHKQNVQQHQQQKVIQQQKVQQQKIQNNQKVTIQNNKPPRQVTFKANRQTYTGLKARSWHNSGRYNFRGRNYSYWRGGPWRHRYGNSWRTYVALSTIAAIAVGTATYYPYAYLDVPEDYCDGITEDGCQMSWTEVDTVEGGVAPACVTYCPWQ